MHPGQNATKGNTESNSAKCEPNDVTTSKQASPGLASNTRLAERQGFEPWDAHTSTVFKTAAIDHSATSPFCREAMCIPRLPGLQAACADHRKPGRTDNSVSNAHLGLSDANLRKRRPWHLPIDLSCSRYQAGPGVKRGLRVSPMIDIDRLLHEVGARRDSLVELTRELVAIPTLNPPGGNYLDICQLLRKRFERSGFEVELHRASGSPGDSDRCRQRGFPRWNIVARRDGAHPGPCVHFNGHTDVVAVGRDWTRSDPFAGEIARRDGAHPGPSYTSTVIRMSSPWGGTGPGTRLPAKSSTGGSTVGVPAT